MTPHQHAIVLTCLWTALGFAVLCFVVGELTGNVSQVDKLWSIVPVVYSWIIAGRGGFPGRAVLGFICLFQHALLVLIVLPVVDTVGPARAFGPLDVVLAVAFVALLALETWADQVQWRFQNEKKRRLAAGEPLTGRYAAGFVHDGLWRVTRHPNYLAEQAIWVVVWLSAVVATHRVDWTVGGVVLLLALFQGSSSMSEGIQLEKYPQYRDYQRRTPRFLPWPKAALTSRRTAPR